MDTIKGWLDFLSSYPVWAKLLMLAAAGVIVAVLVLARPATDATVTAKGRPTLCIKGVRLFPHDEKASVQVTAIVNDIQFKYPSIGGVQWLEVADDMSEQCFDLPPAQRYKVRFTMKIRVGARISDAVSQTEVVLRDTPVTNQEYPLYYLELEYHTHTGPIKAVVVYSFGLQ